MTAKKSLAVALVTALVGAFVPTLIALQMLADNNNNGEVFNTVTGEWSVGYVFNVAAVFYGASFLLMFGIVFGLARLWGGNSDAS